MPERAIIIKIPKCPFCGYEWIPRVEQPKECPHCKRYLVADEAQVEGSV